ncbi:hypothetical protein LguiB_018508 [Lonicera macranthoides]
MGSMNGFYLIEQGWAMKTKAWKVVGPVQAWFVDLGPCRALLNLLRIRKNTKGVFDRPYFSWKIWLFHPNFYFCNV